MPTTARPSLPELQRWMRWVITHPAGVGEVITRPQGTVPLPPHWTRGAEPRRCLPAIGESASVSRQTRLAIYGDGYFLRLAEVLASNYPALRGTVGEHEFDHHLMRDYLVKHPSTFKCIDNVGGNLPGFLKRHPLSRRFPFLSDLARLEWAFHESFFADEWPLLDVAALARTPLDRWPEALVTLDASVRLLRLSHEVVPLWRADGRWNVRRLAAVRKTASPVLVYRRPDGQVRVAEQTPAAFALLSALAGGRTFGAALAAAARRGMPPRRAFDLFREWTSLGVIRRVAFR